MCQWFSSVTLGGGNLFYFSPEERQTIYDGGELVCKNGINDISTRDDLDSHSAICSYYGLDVDKVNKYEFRPLDRKFIVDQINVADDYKKVKNRLCHLNYKELAPPELMLKPIIAPFEIKKTKVTESDMELLKQWDSVWDSVRNSVWDSVWNSVGASVWAYTGSFFNLPKWKYIKHNEGEYPFQSAVDLWEKGLVPSFDGKVWRLHGGKDGRVLKEISKEELSKLTEAK